MGVLFSVDSISTLENYVQKMEVFSIEGQSHQDEREKNHS